ncbi:alpha/beta hydrolase [Staphylococcus durrellii]|uniref:alpha/beta hydrolase n=1 Tax=Staphylococcus durrellii TaxID=2781773 RepID=UPI001F16894F|nr:alpha/beta hydrolase [Staphylococcus durrellii]
MLQYDYSAEILELPNSNQPECQQWTQNLDDYLDGKLTNETVIVAHSLAALHY